MKIFFAVINAATHRKVFTVFGLFAVHVTFICWVLKSVGLWNLDQFFPTLFWYLFSGLAALMGAKDAQPDRDYFSKLFQSNFKAIAVFEFIVVAHSFHFLVELTIVPILAAISLFWVFTEKKSNHALVHNVSLWLLALFALVTFVWSISNISSDPAGFFNATTGRNFILPIALSISSIPVIYLFYCYMDIELAIIRLNISDLHSDELKRYARRRFIGLFCLRPWLFRRAVRDFCEKPAKTKADVEHIIDAIIASYVRIVSPPVVDPVEGWSPFTACDLLKDHGLRSGEYHHDNFGDEWWASAPPVELDEQLLPNTAAFYVEGSEKIVRRLKLKGHFMYEFDPTDALVKFTEISIDLAKRAIENDCSDVVAQLVQSSDFTVDVGATRLSRQAEVFPNERGFDVTFVLERGHGTNAG